MWQVQGVPSNRRTFSRIEAADYGEPDGLCMDSEDGVWSARWQSGKVIRLSPSGVIDVEIDIPTAWHVTCVVFGGELSRRQVPSGVCAEISRRKARQAVRHDRSDGLQRRAPA